ncbi:MAG: ABC-F family ATP-binding cassette domain-containing protein, partial [Paludibacteraceae bacterium]|nr:ABC-F family ATP-binding cassette domain-containing protein [Paludibacteraceae bacterium]
NYVYKLSGGEKRRLYLCSVLMKSPNFLVLDEPTNDLDIVTLNILEEYLRNFKGCVIVVSHDRYFMDKVVDHLLVFEGNAVIRDFPGNYSDYRDWKEKHVDAVEKKEKKAEQPQKVKPKDTVKKKLSFKEQQEFIQLEKDIEKLELEKKELETKMNSGELTHDKLLECSNRYQQVSDLLDEKTMRWLELSEIGN